MLTCYFCLLESALEAACANLLFLSAVEGACADLLFLSADECTGGRAGHLELLKTASVEAMATTAKASWAHPVAAAVTSTLPRVGSRGRRARLAPRGRVRLPSSASAPRAYSCSSALQQQPIQEVNIRV